MTWVRRAESKPRAPIHTCAAPYQSGRASLLPDGKSGDLWRCDRCRKLWRIAPSGRPVGAYEWRPARWWQRLRHRDRARVTP